MPREARRILPYDATFRPTINRGTEHGNDHLRYHGFRQAVSTFSRNALTPLQRHAKARRRASTRRHGAQAPEGCLANTRKIRCITFRLGVRQTSLGWSTSRKAVAARRRRRRPPIEHRRRIICASLAQLRAIRSLSASTRSPKTLFVSFASFFSTDDSFHQRLRSTRGGLGTERTRATLWQNADHLPANRSMTSTISRVIR